MHAECHVHSLHEPEKNDSFIITQQVQARSQDFRRGVTWRSSILMYMHA